jgi:hypothetical protein
MRPRPLIVFAALLAAGCASIAPSPDTARLPPNAYGLFADNDVGAINLAQWAFADAARTRNDPADAARAAAAVDYLAGELSSSPRWVAMSPITKGQMLQAREEVRRALGVAPGAPSQLVVDGLLGAANALAAGDRPAATAALRAPVFTWPPEQTLARLSDMPFLPTANLATQRAAQQRFPEDRGGCSFCW